MLCGVVCVVVSVLAVYYYVCGGVWLGCLLVACLCCLITLFVLNVLCVRVCSCVLLLRVVYLLYRVCFVCMC